MSALNPVTSALPLVFVILVTMVKEAVEDIRRARSDTVANSKRCKIWKDGEFAFAPWNEVTVGSYMLLQSDEQVPADVVILASSEDSGECNIETTNLDGETNLKRKNALHLPFTSREIRANPTCLNGVATCEPPNVNLYDFSGKLNLVGHDTIPIDNSNVIYRSCSLRTTSWAVGLVVYTGHQTKIMMNSSNPPLKTTKLENMLNIFVYISFGIQVVVCIFCAVMYGVFIARSKDHAYLDWKNYEGKFWDDLKHVISFIILFNTLIPISLYVTVEVVKLGQVLFINSDLQMYDEKSDTRANARTSNLNETLGNVEYIFSDKTGTLTQNLMEFFKCTVNGVSYGEGTSEIKAAQMLRNGGGDESSAPKPSGGGFRDARMAALLSSTEETREMNAVTQVADLPASEEASEGSEESAASSSSSSSSSSPVDQLAAVRLFFLTLSLCHTCVASSPDADDNTMTFVPHQEPPPPWKTREKVTYKGASPDEDALLLAAAKQGFEFRGSNGDTYYVRMPRGAAVAFVDPDSTEGEDEKKEDDGTVLVPFKVLYVLEFNSDRKRNSIAIQHPNREIWLYSKGADSTMIPRISTELTPKSVLETTISHMQTFAEEGLRTLVIARRKVDPEEFATWEKGYQEALAALTDRKKKVDEEAAKIEHDFQLLGATAIEDKLQEGVPMCIEMLRKAGIKVWVLTGDKLETAINISFACKLLTNDMIMMTISGRNTTLIKKQMQELSQRFNIIPQSHFMRYALVIEGSALSYCLSDELISDTLSVCMKCGVVVCCRVSPKQKADVVGAIKDNTDACTLSIGDGANDVPMIQRAHVGVGISGNEGMQAVMASDYSVAQFRFLQRLLLVHGRMSYKRLSVVVLYCFYKNFSFTLTMFFFAWFSGFSGQPIFLSIYISLYNCVFTVAPIAIYGLGDQEMRPNAMTRLPGTYALGRLGREATPFTFVLWIAEGIWTAFAIFFVMELTLGDAITPNGRAEDVWFFGTAVMTAVIAAVTIRLCLESNFITFIHVIFFVGSFLAWMVVALIIGGHLFRDESRGTALVAFGFMRMWAIAFVSTFIALFPGIVIRAFGMFFKPTLDRTIRETELILRKKAKPTNKTARREKMDQPLLSREGAEGEGEEEDDDVVFVSPTEATLARQQDLLTLGVAAKEDSNYSFLRSPSSIVSSVVGTLSSYLAPGAPSSSTSSSSSTTEPVEMHHMSEEAKVETATKTLRQPRSYMGYAYNYTEDYSGPAP